MSYENRQEDLDKVLSLPIGNVYEFNIFQGGCACFERISKDTWEFGEVSLCGTNYFVEGVFTKEQLIDCINKAYDEWV